MTGYNISELTRIALALVVTAGYGSAQTAPHFEVASVKVFSGNGRGGPPSGGPGASQFSWSGVPLTGLIARAYMVSADQVTGPDWINSERYSVDAKLPDGALPEQFNVMLQNLLLERFQMKVHRETKVVSGYDLVVAKGGAKLKESVAANGGGGGQFGPDGATLTFNGSTIQAFADRLAMRIRMGDMSDSGAMDPGGPSIVRIADKTGLTGVYDIKLHYGLPRNDTPGEDLRSAVESQLGLNLKPAKISVDLIVVDRAEKVPPEN